MLYVHPCKMFVNLSILWFLFFRSKRKCSRHSDSLTGGPASSLGAWKGSYSMARFEIQTSSSIVMVKRILDRMSSPSESSTKRCAYPHRSSEDYSPSSCFRSPEPSRRAQLVEHFDVPITLLVECQSASVERYHSPRLSSTGYKAFPGNWSLLHLLHTFTDT